MCRTVSDAVHVLDVIVGYDELDAEATGAASKYIPHGGYTQFLRIHGLKGKRIGVLDVLFQGYDDMQLAVYEKHLDTMRYSLPLSGCQCLITVSCSKITLTVGHLGFLKCQLILVFFVYSS